MTTCLPIKKEKSYEQKIAWVYLLNLGFYFIPLYFMDEQWLKIFFAIALLIPFVVGYFWAYSSTKEHAFKPILLMLTIAIASGFLTSGAMSLFSFCCFFIGFFYSLRTAILSYIGISLLLLAINIIVGYSGYFFTFYGMGICLGVGVFGIVEQNRQRIKRQQKQSKDEISHLATALERERIARDLHDVMGHHLASIALKTELADKLISAGKTDMAQQQINQVSQITRDCLSQIRQTVTNYKHQGLSQTLNTLSQTLRDKSIEVNIEGQWPTLNNLTESQLCLMLTELVNNTVKHSKADQCTIAFQSTPQSMVVSYIENSAVDTLIKGNGLNGITERAALLDAQVQYQLGPHFTVTITLPVTETQ
ncbi:histidine kinase [Shewanella inventionis]|uniref:Two-component sensor histidine kinase n=1 Tax=Shewanella inventionis TaxID=1738770 RepID=A0ABQ1IM26_9GAMM|nr:histidine kinase [Shewanella inventionis]MCL1156314.1 histidine kinase [Shewanella inventionis]GGB44583.1 two-component sensor histidine kinase [Shewanella inventionis]